MQEHGVVIDRRGGVVKVKGPHGEAAWYHETELELAAFDTQFISQACVQDGVLGVRVQHLFEPVGEPHSHLFYIVYVSHCCRYICG